MRAILKSGGSWREGRIPRGKQDIPAVTELEETSRNGKNNRQNLSLYSVTTVSSSSLKNAVLCLINGGKD